MSEHGNLLRDGAVMREPKISWVRALKMLTGNEADDIRWNEALGRWEFLLTGADGVVRSQFWGYFDQPPDPVTGIHPSRELDDETMRVALTNLEKTFVGNPYDGAGSPGEEVYERHRFNLQHNRNQYLEAGEAFADMAAERALRLRGGMMVGRGGTPTQRARRIEIPTVIGA